MQLFLGILTIASLGYIVFDALYYLIKPVGVKQISRRNQLRKLKSLDDPSIINVYRDTLSDKLKNLIRMSEEQYEEVKMKLRRLNLDTTPEKIRGYQILYLVLSLLVSLILMLFSTLLGFISIVGAVYAWRRPLSEIEKEIKLRNTAITEEIGELFSLCYYTYRDNNNTDIRVLIKDYLPNAKPRFEAELIMLYEDMRENGEIEGLVNFRKKVPLPKVTRFCELLETRISGFDNLASMLNFKEELDRDRYSLVEKKVDDKKNQAGIISWLLSVPITMLMIVYFYLQFKAVKF